jgi:cell division inhibitor SepF
MPSDMPVTGPAPAEPVPISSAGVGHSCSEVLVLTPRSFNDARLVIEAVRANRMVLVNSGWLEDSPGQRLIDFACGGMAAICGQVHRIAEEVFLFAPAAALVRGADASPAG